MFRILTRLLISLTQFITALLLQLKRGFKIMHYKFEVWKNEKFLY